MLLTGILLGPYLLNLLDPSLLAVSGDLREMERCRKGRPPAQQ